MSRATKTVAVLVALWRGAEALTEAGMLALLHTGSLRLGSSIIVIEKGRA